MDIVTGTRKAFVRATIAIALVVVVGSGSSWARLADASISGRVVDPLGGRIVGATVVLMRDAARVATTSTDAQGEFTFASVATGRYSLEVAASGFTTARTAPVFVGAASRSGIEVALQIGPLVQEMVVSAAATELPQSQVGASVSVIDARQMDASGTLDVADAIRTVPGAQVVQTGARGGATSLFVRGGNPAFTKVLIDGVPVNDIGGAFNFADLETTGVDRVEVLRGSNSVLFGADALAGVVNVTTRRGRTSRPAMTYATDGGSLGTMRQTASVGGTVSRIDYFGAYSHLDTDNDLPNNAFQNDTFAGRVGVAVGAATDLSVTVRQNVSDFGSPGAFNFYGIADDSSQHTRFTTAGATARSQITDRLMSTVRVTSSTQTLHIENPTPTGQPYDPYGFGPNYLGTLVTIRGANGTSATGQALLDFGGTYPQLYDSESTRRSIDGQVDYRVRSSLSLAGGARFDHEDGFTDSGTRSSTTRNTAGAFVEARATVRRVYLNAGLGVDHNSVFQLAATPRLSVAAYLREPSSTGPWGETKITFNAGTGIKAPSVLQELSSLYEVLQGTPSATLSVSPLAAERSRNIDVGVEQVLGRGHVRVRAAFFDNHFHDLIEYVSASALPQLGIPPAAAAASGYGAYVNSLSYDARGLETSVDGAIGRWVRVTAAYTHLSTEVTQSLGSSALEPAINPSYPNTPIGAYAPLVGGRAFRRPANSGSVTVTSAVGRLQAFVSGYFSGKNDDSTFLSDADFGNSLLLPNHDLGAAYRQFDAHVSYAFVRQVRGYVTFENLLNATYQAAFGYPSLPRTVRAGLVLALGGDR